MFFPMATKGGLVVFSKQLGNSTLMDNSSKNKSAWPPLNGHMRQWQSFPRWAPNGIDLVFTGWLVWLLWSTSWGSVCVICLQPRRMTNRKWPEEDNRRGCCKDFRRGRRGQQCPTLKLAAKPRPVGSPSISTTCIMAWAGVRTRGAEPTQTSSPKATTIMPTITTKNIQDIKVSLRGRSTMTSWTIQWQPRPARRGRAASVDLGWH